MTSNPQPKHAVASDLWKIDFRFTAWHHKSTTPRFTEISSVLVISITRYGVDKVTDIRLEQTKRTFLAGETVRCTADGYPAPRYRWIRLPDNAQVSTNDTLNFNVSCSAAAGYCKYMCVASNVIDGRVESVYTEHIYFKTGGRLDSFLPRRLLLIKWLILVCGKNEFCFRRRSQTSI